MSHTADKRPPAVTGAIIVHSIGILFVCVMLLLYSNIVTFRVIPIVAIVALVHISGIFGLMKRFIWSRRYSFAVFAFYALAHFAQVGKAKNSGNLIALGWSIAVVILMLWLCRSFTERDVKQYLAIPLRQK